MHDFKHALMSATGLLILGKELAPCPDVRNWFGNVW